MVLRHSIAATQHAGAGSGCHRPTVRTRARAVGSWKHSRPRRHPASRVADRAPRDGGGARRADGATSRHAIAARVVYFETAPRGAFEDRESPHATLDQRNETFVPHVLAITVGTVVDFPNSDRTYHNVFSLSKTKRFDLGRYAPAGRSRSASTVPAIVRVFCDIHSHMNAFILVFNHRFFAVTDADGRYEIDGVPAGTYTLSAWYEGAVRDQGIGRRSAGPANARVELHGAMKVLASLTNRIFLASAALAVVTVALAVYLVSASVTRETETGISRDLVESARARGPAAHGARRASTPWSPGWWRICRDSRARCDTRIRSRSRSRSMTTSGSCSSKRISCSLPIAAARRLAGALRHPHVDVAANDRAGLSPDTRARRSGWTAAASCRW